MNELATLQTLRNEIPEPTPDQLDPAWVKLTAAINGKPPRRRRAVTAAWVLAATGIVVMLAIVSGNLHLTAQSAQAATILVAAADGSITYSDPRPGPGQYLLSHTRADWTGYATDENGTRQTENEQIIDVYVPHDPDDDWVLYRDWGDAGPGFSGEQVDVVRGRNGVFENYGNTTWGEWVQPLGEIPIGDGATTLAYFDAKYAGGSTSRDEDNFVRIIDTLRSGLVPAEIRASLYQALALIPGVSSSTGVTNLDGVEGVAIGRAEPLRGGTRQEIIIDPETGLVIGERVFSTWAVFGFGVNNPITLTAIETSVVDSAPQ